LSKKLSLKTHLVYAVALGVLVGSAVANRPLAQTVAPAKPVPQAPAIPQPAYAVPTPGVCLLSRDGAIGGSKAGQEATVHMQKLANDIATELSQQRQAIGQGTDTVQSVQQRAQAVGQLEQLRSAQLQRTKLLAEQQIAQALGAAVSPAVAAAKCAVVFERGNAYGWNPAMDITPLVIKELDRQLPVIQFTLAPSESVSRQ